MPCAACHANNNYALQIAPTDSGNSGCHLTKWQQTNNPVHSPDSNTDLFVYDVSRGGQRFLIFTQVKQAETEPMSVVLNWPAKLNN